MFLFIHAALVFLEKAEMVFLVVMVILVEPVEAITVEELAE